MQTILFLKALLVMAVAATVLWTNSERQTVRASAGRRARNS